MSASCRTSKTIAAVAEPLADSDHLHILRNAIYCLFGKRQEQKEGKTILITYRRRHMYVPRRVKWISKIRRIEYITFKEDRQLYLHKKHHRTSRNEKSTPRPLLDDHTPSTRGGGRSIVCFLCTIVDYALTDISCGRRPGNDRRPPTPHRPSIFDIRPSGRNRVQLLVDRSAEWD